jgi:hypothetical protein
MKKAFSYSILILLGAAISSCNAIQDASFTPPNTPSPWFFTNTNGKIIGNIYTDNMHGHPQNPPAGAQVVIAWEMPNMTSGLTFSIFGDTTLLKFGPKIFYAMNLGDSLPKSVVRLLATDTLAVGHLFLTTNGAFKNGDTISFSSLTDGRVIGAL